MNQVDDNKPIIRHIEQAPLSDRSLIDSLRATFLGGCYVRHFKKYLYVRLFVQWTWSHGYRYLNQLILFLIVIRNKNSACKVQGYLEGRNKRFYQYSYVSPQSVIAGVPEFFPDSAKKCFSSLEYRYDFPEIYLAKFKAAKITGGSNMFLLEDVVIHHELFDFVRDEISEELHGRVLMKPKKHKAYWLVKDLSPENLPVSATFVDACAGNYSHWLTEVLPRISMFCADDRYADVPIVINDGLHENILESLFVVTGAGRTIIALPPGRCIDVETLYVVSPTGYVPFGRRTTLKDHPHGEFSPKAIQWLVESIKKSIDDAVENTAKKIVVRRNSGARLVTNFTDIENLLVDEGFIVVEPEKLSFAEQVQLFSQTEIIVGATGAAFANIIFCRPETKIIIMIAKHKSMPYWYWQNMANTMKCCVTYVFGTIVKSASLGIHGDFYVNPRDIVDAISSSDNASSNLN